MRRLVLYVLAVLLWSTASIAAAERAADFSDDQLIDGFERTVFGSEGGGSRADKLRVKKYAGPVKLFVVNASSTNRERTLNDFVKLVNKSVRNLSIRRVNSDKSANMVVFLVDRGNYRSIIRDTLPPNYDTRFLQSNDCSAIVAASNYKIELAFVYIVANETARAFNHCLVEEILQSLGPVNDDWRLKYSIFNDYSGVDTFGVFDWYILNMLYDKRVRPGMSRAETRKMLPAIIADTRKRLVQLQQRGGAKKR
ncbi:MAG TPA: DUF2927 domain-containing protein [Hyphomicrobiales bacterium]|nr:DUF2927 domain-containing protein [Hyphomicrobiales bacterium]